MSIGTGARAQKAELPVKYGQMPGPEGPVLRTIA
jgi:hypothetical protein